MMKQVIYMAIAAAILVTSMVLLSIPSPVLAKSTGPWCVTNGAIACWDTRAECKENAAKVPGSGSEYCKKSH